MVKKATGVAVLLLIVIFSATAWAANLTKIELLGKKLFFDKTLSSPTGQACATCHSPQAGWTGPDSKINAHGAVYPGAVHHRFGNRGLLVKGAHPLDANHPR